MSDLSFRARERAWLEEPCKAHLVHLASEYDRAGRAAEAPLACQLHYLSTEYPGGLAPGILTSWIPPESIQTRVMTIGEFYASIHRYVHISDLVFPTRTDEAIGYRKVVVSNARGPTPEDATREALRLWHELIRGHPERWVVRRSERFHEGAYGPLFTGSRPTSQVHDEVLADMPRREDCLGRGKAS